MSIIMQSWDEGFQKYIRKYSHISGSDQHSEYTIHQVEFKQCLQRHTKKPRSAIVSESLKNMEAKAKRLRLQDPED